MRWLELRNSGEIANSICDCIDFDLPLTELDPLDWHRSTDLACAVVPSGIDRELKARCRHRAAEAFAKLAGPRPRRSVRRRKFTTLDSAA